jgi:single-strand DNA-binding protein
MMNSVNLTGNLGNNPEIKSFQSGKKVARFSLAVNSYGKDRPPVWITCELWDAAVERLQKCSVRTGTRMAVTGSLGLNEYDRTIGKTVIHEKKLYVKVSTFQVLSAKGEVLTEVEEPADEDSASADESDERIAS